MRTLVLTLALVIPGTAHAQAQAAAVGDIAQWLKPNERVIVTARVGCREALALSRSPAEGPGVCHVSGRFAQVSDRMVIMRGDVRYVFPLESVERVERPRDRIWNGAAIGYLVGWMPFALMELDCQSREGCWEGLALAVGTIISGPIGFGIGALSDALIHRPRLVFSNLEGDPLASISPIVTRGGAGVRVSLVF